MDKNPVEYGKDPVRPVQNVNWYDCQEFLKKLNELSGLHFILPTEAQWEYAARGGNKSRGYMYSGSNDVDAVAWHKENSTDGETYPVGLKQPNELGLYDMSGNVAEWCSDYNGRYTKESQTNPTGPSSGTRRVRRGGSFSYGQSDCRVSNRRSEKTTYRFSTLGLRLAIQSQ